MKGRPDRRVVDESAEGTVGPGTVRGLWHSAGVDIDSFWDLIKECRTWNDDWPEWESLDYVAMEAYGIVTGVDDDCDAFDDAVEVERLDGNGDGSGGSGPLGGRRYVRDEDEVARELPRLSVLFPVG